METHSAIQRTFPKEIHGYRLPQGEADWHYRENKDLFPRCMSLTDLLAEEAHCIVALAAARGRDDLRVSDGLFDPPASDWLSRRLLAIRRAIDERLEIDRRREEQW